MTCSATPVVVGQLGVQCEQRTGPDTVRIRSNYQPKIPYFVQVRIHRILVALLWFRTAFGCLSLLSGGGAHNRWPFNKGLIKV